MVRKRTSGVLSESEDELLVKSNHHQPNNQTIEQLDRQMSVYSLTLDEFQHLCDSGKSFGSMNMDEFLNSIWTAEENQVHTTNVATTSQIPARQQNKDKGIAKQPSLTKQGSLTIPEPLSRKTVEEVWSEIHNNDGNAPKKKPNTEHKQPTFGEMTLEDFLIRSGVVREQNKIPAPPQQPNFGHHPAMRPSFVARPVMTVGGGVNTANYTGGMKRGGGYGGRIGNVSGGFGQVQDPGTESPVSHVSLDGLGQIDGGNQYGLDLSGVSGGQKRVMGGPVVERRQRRMIKNRESAARSRARKQAYTVELEAELNQLKEENAHLHQVLAELERQRKQWSNDEARANAHLQTKAQRANGKLRAMRRCSSCS